MMDKKERIINAAIDVFIEKGIEKAKISDIVKAAGIAQGTFYLYFPSKLSVMPAIAEVMVERMVRSVTECVQNEAPLTDQLSQMIDAIFDFTRDHRDIQAMVYAGLTSSEHIKEWETVYQPIYSWMNELLSKAKHAGTVRSSIHVETTSKLCIAFIESAAEQIYLYDHKKDDQANLHKAEVLSFLKHALRI
ncbi:TetR family transcriptional regulator [Bacillus manliponensis]|uniref:TetR family transcriptional regulator n=1 Tax=Bacillus manliponensis TaxID=574376 RepID=A0A073JVS9_9BACI|nr:TetR family transcriptional regulator [Bacillus manliponensis]KEK18385.1 TetR family transcriptional regulator [Bacillus manliponensis]